VDEENNILDGHHRYRACNELEVDVRTELCSGIGDIDAKRLRIIALNLAERALSKADRERLDGERKRLALKMLGEGRGPREVGRLVGRPHTTIIGWRDSAGRADQSAQPSNTTENVVSNIMENTSDIGNIAKPSDAISQKQKALELAASGLRLADIASAIGRDASTVKKWIADPTTTPSTRGYGGGAPRKIDDSEVERLFNAGSNAAEIAREVGASVGTVNHALKRLGLSRAGKKAKNPLADHISRADADALAWDAGANRIVATAKISASSQVNELVSALARLSRAASNLKNRLNKEVEHGETSE
jgi:transposase